MYAAYTAAVFARKYNQARHYGVNLLGAITWGFEFEEQAWYAGFRDIATNSVDKPVLNTFRIFGTMDGTRVAVEQEFLSYDYRMIRDSSVRNPAPDVNALASKSATSATVLVWNYHENEDLTVPYSPVKVVVSGFSQAGKVLLPHYRIDQGHSNSHTVWKEMGSSRNPTAEQISV